MTPEEDDMGVPAAILVCLIPVVFVAVMVYAHRHGGAAMRRTLQQIRSLPEHHRDRERA